jgi:hypothetical protein
MTRDDIIKMAKKAKLPYEYDTGRVLYLKELERFAALVAAAEREKVARWMMGRGYATGHGDSTADLLTELDWQIREQAEKQEPVARVCYGHFTLTQTGVGIGERGMQAYEEAKKRGWVGISDEMEMPKQEPK